MSDSAAEPRRVLAEGRFVRLVAKDGWEWVERTNSSGAAVIAALTDDDRLLLIEQFRVPLGATVIELPAGLAGDEAQRDEDLLSAARRELEEETGFTADAMELVTEGPSSAGLADEVYSLFIARGARRVGAGGGVEREKIQVHCLPLAQVDAWLEERRRAGLWIDPKIYAGLYFLTRRQ